MCVFVVIVWFWSGLLCFVLYDVLFVCVCPPPPFVCCFVCVVCVLLIALCVIVCLCVCCVVSCFVCVTVWGVLCVCS